MSCSKLILYSFFFKIRNDGEMKKIKKHLRRRQQQAFRKWPHVGELDRAHVAEVEVANVEHARGPHPDHRTPVPLVANRLRQAQVTDLGAVFKRVTVHRLLQNKNDNLILLSGNQQEVNY